MNLVPQFGFLELALIAIIALIVVGPKDLPKLMREAGKLVGKAKRMAGEFTAAFDQMAREAEMEELRKEIDDLKNNNPVSDIKKEIDEATSPIKQEIDKEVNEINKSASKPSPPAEGSSKADATPKQENETAPINETAK